MHSRERGHRQANAACGICCGTNDREFSFTDLNSNSNSRESTRHQGKGQAILGAEKSNSGQGTTPVSGRARTARKDQGQVGTALREAYRATVDEAVPDEMLDLLNKLR
jgi:hypothetical protein